MENQSAFICNNEEIITGFNRSFPVLDFIRKEEKLTGTKEGCREGDCGACTVLVGELVSGKVFYKSVNSCLLPVGSLDGKHLVTIEGLNQTILNPIQRAFVEEGATQCGFCTPGFIISLTSYLLNSNSISFTDALDYVAGNLCRCTGHVAIINAVKKVVERILYSSTNGENDLQKLVELNIIPEYFLSISERLNNINTDIEHHSKSDYKHFIVSGGTDLYVQKQEEIYLSELELLTVPLNKEKVKIENDICFIDAMTTVSELMDSFQIQKIIPVIQEYLSLFGSRQIRNKATIGGNIVNASPIGDLTSIFLALNANLHLNGRNNERIIPLKDFYLGYKQLDKSEDEILTSVSFNIPSGNYSFNCEKVSRRKHLDIASVNTSMFIKTDGEIITEIHLSAGGVSPIPLYLENTVQFLTNNSLVSSTILKAVKIADDEISPISDVRGSAEYKRLLLRQLIFCHFIKLFPEIIKPEELL